MEIDVSMFKNNIKKNIRLLVENGSVSEAKKLLSQYEAMVYNDLDVYAIKGVIAILEDNTVDAERFLMEGLEFNKNDFDLLYNLAFLYQNQGKTDLAVTHYKKALIYSKSDEDGEDTYLRLRELGITESKCKLLNSIKVEESRNIVFFHKKGMDSFLVDIIDNLSTFYHVKKVEITDFNQINEEMKHASICWFEWCDELVIYATSLKRESNSKIVCRLHSYEAFTTNINKVNWDMIDLTIFVAEHIKKYVVDNSNINASKCIVIPNSVDISKWTFRTRKKGNKIAYVGYINYKKGPQLLIQAILSMIKINPNFEFHIAGEFQDARDVLYFNQVNKEKNLQKNLYYHGWIDDLDSWLEDKNYLICTSVLESQNMSIMQGMAKGIKPLIHNFVGANSIYNKNLIWTTIDELLDLTEAEYESQEYKHFIEENYSIEKQIEKILGGLSSITIDSSKVTPFNYKEY